MEYLYRLKESDLIRTWSDKASKGTAVKQTLAFFYYPYSPFNKWIFNFFYEERRPRFHLKTHWLLLMILMIIYDCLNYYFY